MPSSENYVRDVKREKETEKARGEVPKNNARKKARRLMVKAGKAHVNDHKDIDHIKPLSKGGAATDTANLRAVPASKNRSFKRKADGSMK